MVMLLLNAIIGIIVIGVLSYYIVDVKIPKHMKNDNNAKLKLILALGFVSFIGLNLIFMFIPETTEFYKTIDTYDRIFHIPMLGGIASVGIWLILGLVFGYYINRSNQDNKI